MSSGYNPPPFKPPDTGNPLALLSLLQSKRDSELRQMEVERKIQSDAEEQVLNGLNAGISLKALIQANPNIPANKIDAYKEIEKQIKAQSAAQTAMSPQSIASIGQSAGGTISPSNQWQPPTEENLAATRQTYSSLPELLGPERGYAAQNVLNQIVGGSQASMQQEAAARSAAEAQARRGASFTEGLQRRSTEISQTRSARLQEEAERRTMDRDMLAEINATGDPETIRKANETLMASMPPDKANALIQRGWADGQAVLAKRALAQRVSPGATTFSIDEAIGRWNAGDRSPETINPLLRQKLIMPNPSPPRTNNDPRTKWLWAEGNDTTGKQLAQIRGVDGMLDRIESLGLAAENDPEQSKRMRGVSGSQAMQAVRRGTAREKSLVSAMGTVLIEFQKTMAGVGNVGQITDYEQTMAANMGPWMTEIIGADGKVSEGFRGRLAAARDMVERARLSVVDPNVRADLEAETKATLARFNPAQRDALKAYAGALSAGTPRDVELAEARMKRTGAADISANLAAERDAEMRARASREADAYMRSLGGPAAGGTTP